MTCITPSRCESTVRPRSQVGGLFCCSSHSHGQVLVIKEGWNSEGRMHRRWTETPLLAGKSPEGCLRRDLLVDGGGAITCVWAAVCPSEKQKRKKLSCHFGWPFWPKDRDRVDLGSGYHCGLTSGSGCGGRRTSLGHGDSGMGGG